MFRVQRKVHKYSLLYTTFGTPSNIAYMPDLARHHFHCRYLISDIVTRLSTAY